MSDKTLHPTIVHLTTDDKFRTQTRLAEAAGVKPHTISGKAKVEAGKYQNPLTFSQMERILRMGPEMGVLVRPDDFFPHLKVG